MKKFKDLFSKQAGDYSKFRPSYPAALFDFLASLVNERELAWDVGTGNGQAAIELSKYFDRVIATDPSRKQLDAAVKNSKIEYIESRAETTTLENNSANLITVAQAFHWFKHSIFFEEVKRVSKPNGILAVWCYELAKFTPAIDAAVNHYYKNIIGEFWEPERKFVESGYSTIEIPFKELTTPTFKMETEWSLDHLVGYLGTWSATQTAATKLKEDPVALVYKDLKNAWGSDPIRLGIWPLSLRVFKI